METKLETKDKKPSYYKVEFYHGLIKYKYKIGAYNGAVLEAEFTFRTYFSAEEHTGMLPEIQTLAAAGGEFFLCYFDNGRETLQPFWLPLDN